MNKNLIIVIVLAVLVVVSAIQAVQLTSLKSKLDSSTLTTASGRVPQISTSGNPVASAPDANNLPGMVGGC